MKHGVFTISGMFQLGDGEWRCIDIGTRTIIAIHLDCIRAGNDKPELRRTLDRAAAEGGLVQWAALGG
jgi:hypothetical protein